MTGASMAGGSPFLAGSAPRAGFARTAATGPGRICRPGK